MQLEGFNYRTNELRPIVYSVKEFKDKVTGEKYSLKEELPCYKIPKKLYGDIELDANHIYGYYSSIAETNVGVLLVGSAGTGKTLTAEYLANLAILDNHPVIHISSIRLTPDLVKFISTFNNCCIYIDEFGKISTYEAQEHFLSVLTAREKKNLFIFTENSASLVNRFMINRPGRIRYRLDFNKLPERVIDEYCADKKISQAFKRELKSKYVLAKEFSFDHLETLISEHRYNPNLTIDELCRMLNIKHIITTFKVRFVSCFYKGEETKVYPNSFNLKVDGENGFDSTLSPSVQDFNNDGSLRSDLLDELLLNPSRFRVVCEAYSAFNGNEDEVEYIRFFKDNKEKILKEFVFNFSVVDGSTLIQAESNGFVITYKILTDKLEDVAIQLPTPE